jgi:hypothetical protein
MRRGSASSTDTETIREFSREDVHILWVNDFYVLPLQGVAEVEGGRCLFEIVDRDSLGREDESKKYWLIALSAEQLQEEEVWHGLFCRKVGTHFDHTGRAAPQPEQVCPEEFYGSYGLRVPQDYADNEVVGWFRL